MTDALAPAKRLSAAVDFSPARSRVTVPRSALRELLADHDWQGGQLDTALQTIGDLRLEVAGLQHERDTFRDLAFRAEGRVAELKFDLEHLDKRDAPRPPEPWPLTAAAALNLIMLLGIAFGAGFATRDTLVSMWSPFGLRA